MKIILTFHTLAFPFFFAMSMSIFAQGSLTPPGAPAPTMKTLDQVEARTIINATNTSGNSINQFIITGDDLFKVIVANQVALLSTVEIPGLRTDTTIFSGAQISADEATKLLEAGSIGTLWLQVNFFPVVLPNIGYEHSA